MHFNLHKTFSTPHGGGGPGSGPVGVASRLADFLPGPIVGIVEEGNEENAPLYGLVMPEQSIGRVKSFYGHFGMIVRAYTYIAMHGPDGLRKVAEYAVLNANYLLAKLKEHYKLAYDRSCMHECVFEGVWADAPDVHALDVSKRLMDYNFHPPTNYFPLIVHEALMIEPTETENKETLDAFADAMIKIAEEAHTNPDLLREAPHNTPVSRLDEVKAARDLVLCCWVPET
jgi:glycine dehydrogenase subunit 2